MGKLQTRLIIAFAVTLYILAETVEAGVVDRVRKNRRFITVIFNFIFYDKKLLLFTLYKISFWF